jgi:cell wall assembly regulator SMI1
MTFGFSLSERRSVFYWRGVKMTNSIWDRFELMLKTHAPALLASLRPPATEAQIAAAESKLGVQFPAEIRRAYSSEGMFFAPFNWWACLDDVLHNWQMTKGVSDDARRELDESLFPVADSSWDELKIAPVWWNERWIPIGLSGTSTSVYFDLDPAAKGTFGQLIRDDGMQDAEWVCDGFDHYLELLIQRVESGRIAYRDRWVFSATGEPVYEWNS